MSRIRMMTGIAVVGVLMATACSGGSKSAGSTTTIGNSDISALPASIAAIMHKPRYADSTWSLLVTDVATGESFDALNADEMSLTGSTRKLFSVGVALDSLGAAARQITTVYRTAADDLVLVAGGDLTFGGRRIDGDTVQVTDFDHNDANGLGSAVLTPQDPLYSLDRLAADVEASGVTSVTGNVSVDTSLFDSYRVPNGNLFITPMMVNENQVDVTITPTQPGQPAIVDYRPSSAAFTVGGSVMTTAAGADETVSFSDSNLIGCLGDEGCTGTVGGTIPMGYTGPLTGSGSFVGTFRIEDPSTYARTAFIEALERHGVTVAAPAVSPNPVTAGVSSTGHPSGTLVASYISPPFSQNANLVLKVSLNLGANLDLSLFGLTKGERTIDGSLAAERRTLIDDFGLNGGQFEFPTNGSGTPDSRAAPRALVQLLSHMSTTAVAAPFKSALPVMGVSGSLATTGTSLPGRGHVFAKPGTTVSPGPDGTSLVLKAQNLAGYIETRGGRKVAYALMVNNAGPVTVPTLATDVGEVFEDEGTISSIIYETL